MPTPTPSPFQQVTDLGPLQQEWIPGNRGRWLSLGFGLLCLAAVPVLALLAAFLAFNAYNTSGAARVDNALFPPLCLAAIALPVGALIVFNTWRSWHLAAALFEQGVAYRRRGPVQQFRWDDIVAVWQSVTKQYRNGVYVGTTHYYTVQTSDGRKVVFSDQFGRNIDVLGRALQECSARLLLPKYWQSLQMGQKLAFGPLALDREKLYAGKKELAWSEIKAVKIERGQISIKRDKGWFNWASATVPQIPNFFVFLELVSRFAPVE